MRVAVAVPATLAAVLAPLPTLALDLPGLDVRIGCEEASFLAVQARSCLAAELAAEEALAKHWDGLDPDVRDACVAAELARRFGSYLDLAACLDAPGAP